MCADRSAAPRETYHANEAPLFFVAGNTLLEFIRRARREIIEQATRLLGLSLSFYELSKFATPFQFARSSFLRGTVARDVLTMDTEVT